MCCHNAPYQSRGRLLSPIVISSHVVASIDFSCRCWCVVLHRGICRGTLECRVREITLHRITRLTDNADSSVWDTVILSSIASLHTTVSVAVQIVTLLSNMCYCNAFWFAMLVLCRPASEHTALHLLPDIYCIAKPVERHPAPAGSSPLQRNSQAC